MKQAIEEDVDVIGLSIMSGAHIPISKKMKELVEREGIEDKLIVVGGVIPSKDIPVLKAMGVHGVFQGGSRFEEIVEFIRKNVRK